jgi:tetratricopeptide (TPR) repeat protein
MARILSHAPEQDIVEESLLWMGRGHLILQDVVAAIPAFRSVAIVATSETGRQEAQRRLGVILNEQIHRFYDQQAWIALLKFHEDQQEAFHEVPLTLEHVTMVAQAYQHVNLPLKAMQLYDQLLKDHPKSVLREEIIAQKVFLAEGQGKSQVVREVGEIYVREYPKGQWRAEVSTALGMESVERQDHLEAIQHLSDVLTQTHDKALQRYVLRQRALVYTKEWKKELALQDLRQVVALDPLDMANVVRLGDFLFDQGDFSDAESLYEHVQSSQAPEALKVWAKYRLGLSLEYQGHATDGQKLLAEVRQLHTQAPEFENTIRTAAVAVLDEFSLQETLQVGRVNEGI